MSNYESAPATLLLATHCAACGKPLVDAVSVEANMGPECRRKYLRAETSPENRDQANKLVAEIALAISHKPSAAARIFAASKIEAVRALGFAKLADKLTKENVAIQIERTETEISVKCPFSESFLEMSRRIPGRFWHGESKTTRFPKSQGHAVMSALVSCYPGATAIGPKGAFVIQ